MIDLRHFTTHGYVRLPRLLPPYAVASMADAVWMELRRKHGIARTDRSTWTPVEPRGLGALRKAAAFNALATPAFIQAINTLLATDDWPDPTSWGDPLVTLPDPTTPHDQSQASAPSQWNVPVSGWHIDFPARGALLLKWLAYLAPVNATGGGTVVLSGSHRLVERFLRQADPADTNVVKHFKFRPAERGSRRIHQKPSRTEVVWLPARPERAVATVHPSAVLRADDREAACQDLLADPNRPQRSAKADALAPHRTACGGSLPARR